MSVAPSSAPAPSSRRADRFRRRPTRRCDAPDERAHGSIDSRDDRAMPNDPAPRPEARYRSSASPVAKSTRAIGLSGSTASPVAAPAVAQSEGCLGVVVCFVACRPSSSLVVRAHGLTPGRCCPGLGIGVRAGGLGCCNSVGLSAEMGTEGPPDSGLPGRWTQIAACRTALRRRGPRRTKC